MIASKKSIQKCQWNSCKVVAIWRSQWNLGFSFLDKSELRPTTTTTLTVNLTSWSIPFPLHKVLSLVLYQPIFENLSPHYLSLSFSSVSTFYLQSPLFKSPGVPLPGCSSVFLALSLTHSHTHTHTLRFSLSLGQSPIFFSLSLESVNVTNNKNSGSNRRQRRQSFFVLDQRRKIR